MILTYKELHDLRRKLANCVIVHGGGTFDILHVGHITYLQSLKTRSDIVAISISNDDWYAERSKELGKGLQRPCNSQADRARVIDALNCVDYVIPDPYWSELPYVHPTLRICERLRPDLHVTIYPEQAVFAPLLKGYGTELVIQPRQPGYATSDIITQIRAASR